MKERRALPEAIATTKETSKLGIEKIHGIGAKEKAFVKKAAASIDPATAEEKSGKPAPVKEKENNGNTHLRNAKSAAPATPSMSAASWCK